MLALSTLLHFTLEPFIPPISEAFFLLFSAYNRPTRILPDKLLLQVLVCFLSIYRTSRVITDDCECASEALLEVDALLCKTLKKNGKRIVKRSDFLAQVVTTACVFLLICGLLNGVLSQCDYKERFDSGRVTF